MAVLQTASCYLFTALVSSASLDTDLDALGQGLVKANKLKDAELVYSRLIKRQPDNKAFLKQEIRLLILQGNAEAALPLAKKLLALSPSDAEAHHLLSYAYIHLNRFEESLPSCKVAMALAPNDSKIIRCYAKSLWKTGKKQEAVNLLLQKAKAKSDSLELWSSVCIAGIDSKNFELAQNAFLKCLELRKDKKDNSNFEKFEDMGWKTVQLDPWRIEGYKALLKLASYDLRPVNAGRTLILASRKFSDQPGKIAGLNSTLQQELSPTLQESKQWKSVLELGKSLEKNASRLAKLNANLQI